VSVHGCDTIDPPSDFVPQVQVAGPICRFAEDLMPIMKVLSSDDNPDSNENEKSDLNLNDDVSLYTI